MERSTFATVFAIRESRISKDEKTPIEVTITVNGERCSFSTFDKVEVLKEKSLFDVFEEHNEQQKAMIGNGISKATHWCSEYTLRLCKDYITEKFQRKDIYLRELNINFIKDFHVYLLKRMKQNTCSKHLKLLKKIINIAVANSYMSFNPFAPYKVERTPVEIEFLDEDEYDSYFYMPILVDVYDNILEVKLQFWAKQEKVYFELINDYTLKSNGYTYKIFND